MRSRLWIVVGIAVEEFGQAAFNIAGVAIGLAIGLAEWIILRSKRI